MTYTTLANGDQKNSLWIPRALTAVGLGALAFASGTHYRNSNNDVVAATTNLVRGGGGENKVFTLADDGLTKKENALVMLAVCPLPDVPAFLKPVCSCAMKNCGKEIDACGKDSVCYKNVTEELPKCFDVGSFPEFEDCADQLVTFAGPGVALQQCLVQNCVPN